MIIISAESVDLDGRVEHLSQHQNNNQFYSNGFISYREKEILVFVRDIWLETIERKK
jgi:hypothetical protein